MFSKEALLDSMTQSAAENTENILSPVDFTQPVDRIVDELRYRLEQIVKLNQNRQIRSRVEDSVSDQDAIATVLEAVNTLDLSVKASGLSGEIIGAINVAITDIHLLAPALIRA